MKGIKPQTDIQNQKVGRDEVPHVMSAKRKRPPLGVKRRPGTVDRRVVWMDARQTIFISAATRTISDEVRALSLVRIATQSVATVL